MKFVLDETRSDISSLIKACAAAEQAGAALPNEVRVLLARCGFMLGECRSVMIDSVATLEEAAARKAGLMDSLGRHEEIARMKNGALEHVAGACRHLLQRYTPAATIASNTEVI